MPGPLSKQKFKRIPRGLYGSPIARRLVIATIALSSAIAVFATAWELYLDYRVNITYIEGTLSQIQRAYVPAIASTLWATNRKELQIVVNGIKQLPDVEYVAIDDGKTVWAKSGELHSTHNRAETYPLSYRHRGELYNIGYLHVSIDMVEVYRQLLNKLWTILLINAVKTFVVASFLLWLFHRLVTRHLYSVTEYAHALDGRDWQTQLSLQRRSNSQHQQDEFDVLVDAMNRMRERLANAMADLTTSEARYRGLFEHANDAIFIVDPDSGSILDTNRLVSERYGYSREELLQMNVAELSSPETAGEVPSLLERLKREKNSMFLRTHISKDGRRIPVEVSSRIVKLEDGEVLESMVRDISERLRMEDELNAKIAALAESEQVQSKLVLREQQEHARLLSLLAAMNIGILFEDVDNRVIYANPTFRRLWLIDDAHNLIGHPTSDVLNFSANVLARPDHFSKHILKVPNTHEVSETFEIIMEDGRTVTQLSYPVQDNEGRFIGRLWVYEDVTRERQTAEQLIYLAERDSLTGLFNRHRFQRELERMLDESERRHKQGALLFFDLDEFKYINDTFGHRAGDAMLIRVAGEISSLVRRHEIITRIGGDEFAILIPEASESDSTYLAERIVRAIAQIPFRFDGNNLRLTTSLGIAIYPMHGTNVEELVAHADAAMYQAKEAGKNTWRVYQPDRSIAREVLARLTWHDRICHALDNQLMRLHFQGVYHTRSRQLSHLEALVRMVDSENAPNVIMPGNFIPPAEKTGKILDIDRWVLSKSIAMLARMPGLPGIAVNISGRSIDEPTLTHFIADSLRQSGVAAGRLLIELTETAAVSDLQDAQRFIEALHNIGCVLCLDDFGSGFSSFAYLKHLKADILKIDGIFIRDLPNDRDNQVFVKSIVDVARGLDKITVAEFVEDAATLELLRNFGVTMVQGYYLDKPVADHPAFAEMEYVVDADLGKN